MLLTSMILTISVILIPACSDQSDSCKRRTDFIENYKQVSLSCILLIYWLPRAFFFFFVMDCKANTGLNRKGAIFNYISSSFFLWAQEGTIAARCQLRSAPQQNYFIDKIYVNYYLTHNKIKYKTIIFIFIIFIRQIIECSKRIHDDLTQIMLQ